MRLRAVLIAALALLLPGCSHLGGSARAGIVAGTLRWADAEDIDNLNPLLSTQTVVNDLSALTMGYFFVFDRRGNPIPSLCLEVPSKENHLISPDGKSLTFKLRRGVVWHDGKPFTSADVAFTVKTILDPTTNVLTREGWDDIARVDTPDAYTVVFHLKQPYAPFINRFFTPVGNPAILPKHLLDGHDVNHATYNALPVGLGPFRYVRWSRESEIVMEAFPQYWGDRPKLARVIFKIVPDVNTAITQLRTHELDLFVRVPTAQLLQARAIEGTRTIAYDTNSYGHVDFNITRPALADPRVREALVRAIDVRLLWEKVDHRSGYLACTPISHMSWAYDAHAPCYGFDLAKARRLLDASGWRIGDDGLRHKGTATLRLEFTGNTGNPGLDTRVALIDGWFKQIGVDLEYKRFPTNELFASYAAGGIAATRNYDLVSYAWSLPPDPDIRNLIACSRISPKGQNYMGYCNRDVDRALTDALHTYDRARRRADYLRVQELLARDIPFIVLSQRTDHATFGDYVSGLEPGPTMVFWNPTQIAVRAR
jgi:peptide/nickel transport system substrate-binding protein